MYYILHDYLLAQSPQCCRSKRRYHRRPILITMTVGTAYCTTLEAIKWSMAGELDGQDCHVLRMVGIAYCGVLRTCLIGKRLHVVLLVATVKVKRS